MMIAGKTFRIKSKSRFSLFVVLCIVFLTMLSNSILGLSDASSLTKAEYHEIEVQSGDTLWHLAHTYMPAQDVRQSVHTLKSINGISAGELQAGQILLIPFKV